MKEKFNRERKGITLVALVVTIVVLLILAGVSINLVVGNNGVIVRAQKAKNRQLAESVRETISTELLNIESEEKRGTVITEEQKQQRIVNVLKSCGFDPATNKRIKINNTNTLVIIDTENVISIVTGKNAVLGEKSLWDWVGESSTKEVGICGYNGTETDVTIPEYVVDGNEVYTVTAVRNCGDKHDSYGIHSKNTSNDHKFRANTTIKNLTMLDNVKTLDGTVFFNNTTLESVKMSDDLQEVTGGATFFGCSNLKSCVLSKSITKIPNNLFQNCSSLQAINIPDGVTEIGEAAFSGVTSVEKIVIPSSVKVIGKEAFYVSATSSKLKEVVIEGGVEQIGEMAFGNNRDVNVDLHLPQTLSSSNIGKNAFGEFGADGGANVYLYDGTKLSRAWID